MLTPFPMNKKNMVIIMNFILDIFKNIPALPLFEYVAGGFAFSFLFYSFYRIVGVEK